MLGVTFRNQEERGECIKSHNADNTLPSTRKAKQIWSRHYIALRDLCITHANLVIIGGSVRPIVIDYRVAQLSEEK